MGGFKAAEVDSAEQADRAFERVIVGQPAEFFSQSGVRPQSPPVELLRDRGQFVGNIRRVLESSRGGAEVGQGSQELDRQWH
jgi:hypothetical protein